MYPTVQTKLPSAAPNDKHHLPSPTTPSSNATSSNDTLTDYFYRNGRAPATSSSSATASASAALKSAAKYRSSFSTRQTMHQARQEMQIKTKTSYSMKLGKSGMSTSAGCRTKAELTEKLKLKALVNKRLKEKLGNSKDTDVRDSDEEQVEEVHSEDEDSEPFYERVDISSSPSRLSRIPIQIQDQSRRQQRQDDQLQQEKQQFVPPIYEHPPTPPVPVSNRENVLQDTDAANYHFHQQQAMHHQMMNHSQLLSQQQPYHGFPPPSTGYPQQPYYYPSILSPNSAALPGHYPMHSTVVVYQYGLPHQPPPFYPDQHAHYMHNIPHHMYPQHMSSIGPPPTSMYPFQGEQQQEQALHARISTPQAPSHLAAGSHLLLPSPWPIAAASASSPASTHVALQTTTTCMPPTYKSGTLSSTLALSPARGVSPATAGWCVAAGGVGGAGNGGAKMSRANSGMSVGALVEPEGGIFGLQALC